MQIRPSNLVIVAAMPFRRGRACLAGSARRRCGRLPGAWIYSSALSTTSPRLDPATGIMDDLSLRLQLSLLPGWSYLSSTFVATAATSA
ncbi:hypothetical protein E2562_017786 [Oryza meyeriana var. granulata]|uniref:Uncharacterized protein n=1 Tax=Oryza meyeriana var. granulata TaxID=110450 RepID=A0A6G1BM34_9ORYZ|nr:hypothetical protein E2562_017786 [Oryza meyeriana var. granulata]